MRSRRAAASWEISARSNEESSFQADQRTRNIWCKTLAPSTVSGTGGRSSGETWGGELERAGMRESWCYFIPHMNIAVLILSAGADPIRQTADTPRPEL